MLNINKKCMSFPWANYAKIINWSRIRKHCLTIKIFIYFTLYTNSDPGWHNFVFQLCFFSGTWLHFELCANIGSQAWNVSGTKSHVTRVSLLSVCSRIQFNLKAEWTGNTNSSNKILKLKSFHLKMICYWLLLTIVWFLNYKSF